MSSWYEHILHWYFAGYWTAENVNNAVRKGRITQEAANRILDAHGIVPADSDLGEAIIEETVKRKTSKAKAKTAASVEE